MLSCLYVFKIQDKEAERSSWDTLPAWGMCMSQGPVLPAGKEEAEVRKDVGRNRYFTPEQAIEYGIIDRIVRPREAVRTPLTGTPGKVCELDPETRRCMLSGGLHRVLAGRGS